MTLPLMAAFSKIFGKTKEMGFGDDDVGVREESKKQ